MDTDRPGPGLGPNRLQSAQNVTLEPEEVSVGLVDLLTWIGEGKKLIAGACLVAAIGSVAVALWLPNEFTARATVLPPGSQQQSGSAAALAALGALGGIAGGLAGKTPDDLYVGLLRSDSVVRALDERFQLRQRWELDTLVELKMALPKIVRVSADRKSGVISIEVDDRDPGFAAALANGHVDELISVLSRLAVSEAQQRRQFFEQQLAKTKEGLVKAEQDFRTLQERTGVIVLDKQAEAMLLSAAQIRGQIAEREVRLRVLRSSATPQNPDVVRLVSEINALREELARAESASTRPGTRGSTMNLQVAQLPEAAVDYVRARRELKIQETLMEGLVRQYEIARLDEAKEGPSLQVVDRAQPPDRKSKPKRALLVVSTVLATGLAALLFTVTRAYLRFSAAEDPRVARSLTRLRGAWSWGRRNRG